MIRRLNKMESQRLGNRLDSLSAEVEQSRSLISREQKELQKQLTQIREVKGNPPVSAERRKLSQELSCNSETRRHGSSGETLGIQQRYRSLSTGDRYRGAPLTQLPPLNGRSRSHSSSNPVRLENDDPSRVFRKLSGGSNGTNRNSHSGAWPGISTSAKCNDKPLQRSLSTGTYPRFSAWETIGKSDVTGLKRDDSTPASTKIDSEKSAMNRTWRQDPLDLELTQSQTRAWKETRSFLRRNKISATASSEDEGNSRQKGNEAMISGQNSELVSISKERRQRSFSTNSAPTISRGRVVEEYKEEPSKANKISSDEPVSSASSKQRRYSTNSRPRLVNGEVVDVSGDKKSTNRNSNHLGVAAQLIRRQRSLSTNCPPVILENETVIDRVNNKDFYNPLTSVDDDKQRIGSRSEEEEQNTHRKHAMSNDIPSESCQHISTVGRKNKTEQAHMNNELSLPRL